MCRGKVADRALNRQSAGSNHTKQFCTVFALTAAVVTFRVPNVILSLTVTPLEGEQSRC